MLTFLSTKYPLEKHFFLIPRIVLKVIGFYPETKPNILNNLWPFFNFLVMIYGNYLVLFYGIYYLPRDISKAMDAICPFATSIVSLLKMCCIWWYRWEIKELIERVHTLNEAQNSEPKVLEKRFHFTFATRLSALMLFVSIITIALYFIRALVVNYLSYRRGELIIYDMPFKMMFPEIMQKVPYAPWSFLFSHWYGCVTASCFIGVDGLFLSFCSYFTTLLKSLAIDLKTEQSNLIESKFFTYNKAQEEEACLRLSKFIDRHNEIYDLVTRFSNVMSELTFAHFVSSGMIIATSVICMLLIPGLGMLTYIAYASAVLMEIIVFCIGGTLLSDAGQEVSLAAYSSPWYLASVKVQKMTLMLIIRAQRTLVVKVPFFAPSLPALTQILRFVGSVVALAKSIL